MPTRSGNELGQGHGALEVLERDDQLYSDLTAARQAQIRTAVSTHEEAMGI